MKEQYDYLFNVFQTNKIPVSKFEPYVQQKCGYLYDEQIFGQLIELSLDGQDIDLETLIKQYQETYETLAYRVESNQSRIKELKLVQQQLQDKLKSETSTASLLKVQIMDAQFIETLQNNINLYVKISLGTQQQRTRSISNLNPKWSETFDFTIKEQADVVITLYDELRDHFIIGFVKFSFQELTNQQLKDVTVNLTNQDQMKIKTKLHVVLKYINSPISLLKQEEQKLSEEITALIVENKDNQQALQILQKVFTGNESNMQITQDLPTILEIQPCEIAYVDSIDGLIRQYVEHQLGLFFKMMGAYVALLIISSLYKPEFPDLTLTALFIAFTYFRQMSKKYLRAFLYLYVILLVYQFVWLCMFTGKWQMNPYKQEGEKRFEKFILAISYLAFIVRIPLTILMWKFSIKFEEFYQ
ncbi:hypothetical protein pb186bvf_020856 [Paramecium bursaria]